MSKGGRGPDHRSVEPGKGESVSASLRDLAEITLPRCEFSGIGTVAEGAASLIFKSCGSDQYVFLPVLVSDLPRMQRLLASLIEGEAENPKPD